MFLGEGDSAPQRSGLAGVYSNSLNSSSDRASEGGAMDDGLRGPSAMGPNGQLTPPDDFPISGETAMGNRRARGAGVSGVIRGWMEIWDYAGGSSFRAFAAEDASRETRSLFVFFDSHSISRDLKRAYVLPTPRHLHFARIEQDRLLTCPQACCTHRASGRAACLLAHGYLP